MSLNKRNMKSVKIPVVLERVGTRRDNTIKLEFGTSEIPPKDAVFLMNNINKYGVIAFSPEDISREELEAIEQSVKRSQDIGKSPSQRLRSVLFLLWKAEGEPQGFSDKDRYYERKMEQIIEHFKRRLDQ